MVFYTSLSLAFDHLQHAVAHTPTEPHLDSHMQAHDFGTMSKIKRIFKVHEMMLMSAVHIYASIQRQIILQVFAPLNPLKKRESNPAGGQETFCGKNLVAEKRSL